MSAFRIFVKSNVLLSPEFFDWRMGLVVRVVAHHCPSNILWITSAWRPESSGRHADQQALDFDVELDLAIEPGKLWAAQVQRSLGFDWDVIWHQVPGRGGYHLHVEDETRKGRAQWTSAQQQRLSQLA